MKTILELQADLTRHPIYQRLGEVEFLRHFMRHHVFAVWDFMSLLKSLQRHLTCVAHPWHPSNAPASTVRLINQIVLGEESDLDQMGHPISHFELYLRAMEEVGAPTSEVRDFLSDFNLERVPAAARPFVAHNLQVAAKGHPVEVAASFFFGREKLIPEMFEVILETLRREKIQAPSLIYYLERHIEVDGHEHGPLALQCLEQLTAGKEELKHLGEQSGAEALRQRALLWDRTLASFRLSAS